MINLGLTRITHLVKQLTHPTWKAVHVAGTNGKGSVAAYLSSLFLRQSKPNSTNSTNEVRIGRFTSPHLIDRWDCITVNDNPVSESLFLSVEAQVKSAATQIQADLQAENAGQVTEFELLTATAFEIFSQQQCQVAVVECGMGGRLDATNVLTANQVAISVITKIGLDHQGILGDTVDQIAREKAGIIKPGVPVVVDGTNTKAIKSAIQETADQTSAEVTYTKEQPEKSVILPAHQLQNLETALLAFDQARSRIPTLTIDAINQTKSILPTILSDVSRSYPGRLQHLSINTIVPDYRRQILLDGAHNPQSAGILRQYIDELPTAPKRVHWILAVSQGKDASQIFEILLRHNDTVTFCGFSEVQGMPWVRSTNTSELVGRAREMTPNVRECQDIAEALEIVCGSLHGSEDLVVVAGSLYLVSDLLRLLRQQQKNQK